MSFQVIGVTDAIFSSIYNPNQLIIETFGIPDTIDPASSYETFGDALIDGMYEYLVTYGHKPFDLQGEIASNWTIALNAKSINFTIERGHFFILPETGEKINTEINAWIMKYSIDRTVIIADSSGYGWMLDTILQGITQTVWDSTEKTFIKRRMDQFDVNMTHVQKYLDAKAIEVVDDWTLRVNLKIPYVAAVSIFALNVGVVLCPYWIATNAPSTYTEYKGLDDEEDNTTGMVPLDLWFPGLQGNYEKLGFPTGWKKTITGVVPSTGVESTLKHEKMTRSGCGSGPYYLVESETIYGQKVTYAKNNLWEGFIAGQGGHTWPNALESVIIKTVEDSNARLLDLQDGECDLLDIPISMAEQVIDIEKFHADGQIEPIIPDINVFHYPSLILTFLGMNQNYLLSNEWIKEAPSSKYNASEWKAYPWSTHYFPDNRTQYNNPFANYEFRRAFIKSVDTKTYINIDRKGFGIIPEGCIPYGLRGHTDFLIEEGYQPTYDPAGAKILFHEIGWQGNITLLFPVRSAPNPWYNLKEEIESMEIGIMLEIKEASWPEYLVKYRTSPAFLIGWAPDYADPDNYVENFYHTLYAQDLNYSNPTVNQLIEEAREETNSDIREKIYFAIETNASRDHPFIPLYHNTRLSISRHWIQGDYASVINPVRKLYQPWERIYKYIPSDEESTNLISTTDHSTTSISTTTPSPKIFSPTSRITVLSLLSIVAIYVLRQHFNRKKRT